LLYIYTLKPLFFQKNRILIRKDGNGYGKVEKQGKKKEK